MSALHAVIDSGVCVGCGACKVVAGDAISIGRNKFGYVSAAVKDHGSALLASAGRVCPFSDDALNEDDVGEVLFSHKDFKRDRRIGYYQALFAGRVSDDKDLISRSSGGLTTWVLMSLYSSGEIDGVIHVGGSASDSGDLFCYAVSENLSEISGRTKSRYYSVNLDEAINGVRGNGKRYAFVGVPCFVKSVRLLCESDLVLKSQIKFCLALVCGHMKSSAFAELFAWQVGVRPSSLKSFDFRVKDSSRGANDYSVEAVSVDGVVRKGSTRNLYGSNWGHAFFQLKACDYCDDVMGELADASFGDAWLPKYEADWRGTNILISRNSIISTLLEKASADGEIFLDPLSEVDVVASQGGNYRHRWDGLSVRLEDARRTGGWVPRKRISAGSRRVSYIRKAVVRLRQRLAFHSHEAFYMAKVKGDLSLFMTVMRPLTDRMDMYSRLMRMASFRFWVERLGRFRPFS